MSRALRASLLLGAVVLTGCQSATMISTCRVSAASTRKEQVRKVLADFAATEGLKATAKVTTRVSGVAPYVAYESSPVPGVTLSGYALPDGVVTRLVQQRQLGAQPTASFDQLDQKLRNRLTSAFGNEVNHKVEIVATKP